MLATPVPFPEWEPSRAYPRGAHITFQGRRYVAENDSLGVWPPGSADWDGKERALLAVRLVLGNRRNMHPATIDVIIQMVRAELDAVRAPDQFDFSRKE